MTDMMTAPRPGSATMQGDLWGPRARDYAELQEGHFRPLYESVLRRPEITGAEASLGVVRDRLGGREDRFFATVFLGSGGEEFRLRQSGQNDRCSETDVGHVPRRLQLQRARGTRHSVARRDLAHEIWDLPRLRLAYDRGVAPARLRFPLCYRLSL